MWALGLNDKAKLECMLFIFIAKFHMIDLKLNFLYVNHDYMRIISIAIVSAVTYEDKSLILPEDNIKSSWEEQGYLHEGGIIYGRHGKRISNYGSKNKRSRSGKV